MKYAFVKEEENLGERVEIDQKISACFKNGIPWKYIISYVNDRRFWKAKTSRIYINILFFPNSSTLGRIVAKLGQN